MPSFLWTFLMWRLTFPLTTALNENFKLRHLQFNQLWSHSWPLKPNGGQNSTKELAWQNLDNLSKCHERLPCNRRVNTATASSWSGSFCVYRGHATCGILYHKTDTAALPYCSREPWCGAALGALCGQRSCHTMKIIHFLYGCRKICCRIYYRNQYNTYHKTYLLTDYPRTTRDFRVRCAHVDLHLQKHVELLATDGTQMVFQKVFLLQVTR